MSFQRPQVGYILLMYLPSVSWFLRLRSVYYVLSFTGYVTIKRNGRNCLTYIIVIGPVVRIPFNLTALVVDSFQCLAYGIRSRS